MERTLERVSDSRLAKQVWKYEPIEPGWIDPGRDDWRIFEGGTGSTLPMPCCEDDDDDEVRFCSAIIRYDP